MGTIFISYRREDSEGQAGRMYRDLVAVFGAEAVFMDVAAIKPGRDFRKVIHQSLDSCGVFLAVIGKGWVEAKDGLGGRRLDDPGDFVRIETAAALKRDIPVIPVLVQGAAALKQDQLPDELKDLAFRNAIELTHPRWDSDIQLLINALRPYVSAAPGKQAETQVVQPVEKAKSGKTWLIAAAVVLMVIIGLIFWPRQKVTDNPATASTETATPAANAPADYTPAANAPAHVLKRSPQKTATPPAKSWSVDDISLAAQQQPLANNPKRYTFRLWLKTPSEVSENISGVHYDLVYDPNPLSLEGSSAPPFSAVYEGWGCYETVVVTVSFRSYPQFKKTFNMCHALN